MSSQNDCNPDSTSSVLGDASQKGNTPYTDTEMSGPSTPDLNDTTAQPRLANPGSNDNILSSEPESDAATVGRLMDSIQSYIRKEGKCLNEVAFYILPIVVYQEKTMGPAIFDTDYNYIGKKRYVKCFMEVKDFIGEFLARKKEFNDGLYPDWMVGLFDQVVDRAKLVHTDLMEWPYSRITPKIVRLETSKLV